MQLDVPAISASWRSSLSRLAGKPPSVPIAPA
jgi:hypothetical protein